MFNFAIGFLGRRTLIFNRWRPDAIKYSPAKRPGHLSRAPRIFFMPVSNPFAELTFSGLLIGAYLLGSIPWGLIFARLFAREDIRLKGSGNIGATNVTREAGLLPGLLTLAGDILKGAIPVYLARVLFGSAGALNDVYVSAVALAAFLGHLYPVYLKFRDGGKGVATAAGCFVVISPAAVLAAAAVFMLMLLTAKRVSAGSLAAAAALPIAIWIFLGSAVMIAAAGILAILIFIRHRGNLMRLAAGEEPEFKFKKKPSA
jgi:glycerol-3-phosphate acyltransferase PlsY